MGRENHPPDPPPLLESANAEMARAIATAQQVAASDAAVLLIGESGTGKNVLAHAIHDWSPRRARPFVTVPRAALTERRNGGVAFADLACIQAADGGTLFLAEVGELPAAEQAKLIRFFDEQRVETGSGGYPVTADIRVIAATSRDIEADVHAGRFREDLFFRLSVVTIALPPLRDRADDLTQLTDHLLAKLAAHYGRAFLQLTPEVHNFLHQYHWPGNVRELLSVLERLVVLSRSDTITADDLPERLLAPRREVREAPRPPALSLHELERHQIELALRECPTLEDAANRLGINPTTLWRKRKRYGLT